MKRVAFMVDEPNARALRALNYTPEVAHFRRISKKGPVLGDLLREMGPAYGAVFTRIDCERQHGVELLSQSDMFKAEPTGRVIRRDSMARPEAHKVRRFDVLLAGAGTLGETELYGRSVIADARLAGKYVGPDSMTLVFSEPGSDLALFAFAFLSTRAGIRAVRSTSYGTKILRFRKDLLKTLPIPPTSSDTVARVAKLVRKAVEGREDYAQAMLLALQVLYDLPLMRDAMAMCAHRRRAVLWHGPLKTLSAWNVASSGGVFAFLQSQWSTRLKDVLKDDGVFNGPRFARVACEPPHGIDFMSQRDVFLMRPAPHRIVRPPVADRLLFVPESCILAGSHGQLSEGSLFGKVELAVYGAHRCGVTQDILRIMPTDEHRAIVFAFLATTVGQALLKATAVGTSIPSMRLDLLAGLPFPELGATQTRIVEAHLSRAERARLTAAASESLAIKIVEEEVLPAWLG